MINLLPPVQANAIRYGRQNAILRNWLIGASAAIIGLVLILAGGWVYIDSQAKTLKKNIAVTNQQLQAQNLSGVQKDAKLITGDIKVINKVLSQEVRFSELIKGIGGDMPPGTVLSSLSLSNKVTGAIDLSANAKDYASAAQISVNLSDPNNKLFSKVDIINISCSSVSSTPYKCTAGLRALFSPTAQTKFLSVPTGSKS